MRSRTIQEIMKIPDPSLKAAPKHRIFGQRAIEEEKTLNEFD